MKKKLFLIMVMILQLNLVLAQKIVTGIITDPDDNPMIGVTVQSDGNGAISDLDGNYSIKVKDNKSVITFSFMGYKTETVVVGTRNKINVKLSEDTQLLEEVVVTGYGNIKKGNMVSAYTSVSAKDISKTVNTTLDQALQGRVAGVTITQNSGQPGGGLNVNIRGIGSVNGNCQPLYVIDGVEISGSDASNGTNPIAGINPSDILGLDILQGPAATALYGSRGTDGVILITTKRGEAGKTKINYEFSLTEQFKPEYQSTMPLNKYAEVTNITNEILGLKKNDMFSNPSVLGEGTNWQEALFNNAMTYKHQLSLSGGNDKNRYYLSAEKFNQDGVVIGSYFDRLSLRANLDNELYKNIKLSTSLSFSQTEEDLSFSENDVILKALQMAPNIPVQNADGTWGTASKDDPNAQYFIENPIALSQLIDNRITRTNFNGSMRLSYDVPYVKGLNLSTNLVVSMGLDEGYYFKPTYEMGAHSNTVANSKRNISKNTNWRWTQMIEYKRIFNKKHDVNLMFTHEASGGYYNRLEGSSSGHLTNIITELQLGNKQDYNVSSGRGDNATMESYLGRLNYSYDNRYIASVAYRLDGSSLFARNNRWASFPSAAIAWRISNEKFFKNIAETLKINDFRLRFETGLTGKSMWGYKYLSKMANVKTEWGTGYYPQNIENDDFQWESTMTYNYGIDLSLFNNRLQVVADYYQRYTKNMLGGLTTPWYMGLTTADWSTVHINSPMINNGSVENKGWAIQLKGIIVDNKDFRWTSTFNISRNKNKLTELSTKDTEFIQRQIQSFGNNFFTSRSEIGSPLWMMYGYVSTGVYGSLSDVQQDYLRASDPSIESNKKYGKYNTALPKGSAPGEAQSYAGDLAYVDFNNDGVIDEKDQVFIGNPWPKFTGGFINDFTYKGFSLSVVLTYSLGNDVYNLTASGLNKPGESQIGRGMLSEASDWAKLEEIYDDNGNLQDVIVTNPTTRVPRVAPNSNHGNYDRLTNLWVEDGSYLRCKNIQLGYSVPSRYLAKTRIIRSLQATLSVQNLFTITKYSGYDPEVGSYTQRNANAGNSPVGVDFGRYPSTRSFTFGLNVGF